LDCTIHVLNDEGVILFETGCIVAKNSDSKIGLYKAKCFIPPHLLNAGNYKIKIFFGQDQSYVLFMMDDGFSFNIENTATGRGSNMTRAPGIIRPLLDWESTFQELGDSESIKAVKIP
jgi:lipopolysaccharide transport system ATP-binding protein